MPNLLGNELLAVYTEVATITGSFDGTPAPQFKFTWNSNQYDALSAIEILGDIFNPGGFTADNALTLTVAVDVFGGGDTPKPHQIVTYQGNDYRITQIKNSPDGSGIVIVCNDPDRGTGIVPREI